MHSAPTATGVNRHGKYTHLSPCRQCGCEQFHDEHGPVRDEANDGTDLGSYGGNG